MARQRRKPVGAEVVPQWHAGVIRALPPISREDSAPQTTTDELPLWALHARFAVETDFVHKGAPAYILGVSRNSKGGGPRCRVLLLAKSGRYVNVWQPRRKLGPIDVVRVNPGQVEYGWLRAYLGSKDIPCTPDYSVELAVKMREILAEDYFPKLVTKPLDTATGGE
jgi:hypothetical protein